MVRPRAISRASGCKINTSANLSVLGGRNFQYIPPLVSVILHYLQFDETKRSQSKRLLVVYVIFGKI